MDKSRFALIAGMAWTVGCGAAADRSAARIEPPREVEELDLFQVEGDDLYVYSRTGGLSVVDVSDATAPTLVAFAPIDGQAGELFVRNGDVLLVLDQRTAACDLVEGAALSSMQGEVATLAFDGQALTAGRRVCFPGEVVASRLVGTVLYVVTSDWEKSWVHAFDTAVPGELRLADSLVLANAAEEIHVTPHAIFVAQPDVQDDGEYYRWDMTRVTYVDITDPAGALVERGSIRVEGSPQGRFHLDATATTFRLVTFDNWLFASRLHIIDITDPDALALLGSSDAIGSGEQLYATRFVDDRAYVVTFRRTDPLWVLDLSDATAPHVIGELWVPGWSDFIFPRGDRLITVGHGDGGAGVALSAFDVTVPESPALLDRLELGSWGTQSEATDDHRGLRIFEPGELGAAETPIIALPTSWDTYDGNVSGCQSHLQLVELSDDRFIARGGVEQEGKIRRTLAVDHALLSISDLGILSIDVADLDAPSVAADVGFEGAQSQSCWYYDEVFRDGFYEGGMFMCAAQRASPGVAMTTLLALVTVLRARARRRG